MRGTAETEQGLRRLTLRAHSRVHQVCRVIVGFHVLCVDLGFHVAIGVGRLTVQQDDFERGSSKHCGGGTLFADWLRAQCLSN